MTWSVSDIPSLKEKTVLITGANTGIGFYAARQFAKNGAQVILACRTPKKMADAASKITSEFPTSRVVQIQLDLSDLDNVRQFPARLKETGITKIDILLLNAGVAETNYKTSKQGLELMFATNHLGHWLLTGLVLDYIKNVPDSRIISVSSMGHRQAKAINYEIAKGKDLDKFEAMDVYCQSKLANHWFTKVLQHKLEDMRAKTIAIVAHPGGSSTDLIRHVDDSPSLFMRFGGVIIPYFLQSAEEGSWPLLYAATDPNVKKGNYYAPYRWTELAGPPVHNGFQNPVVFDIEKARELWMVSEDITGFRYST